MATMKATAAYQSFQAQSGNQYTADSNGMIANVATGDVMDLLNSGASLAFQHANLISYGAAAAKSATAIVASVGLTNTTFTIAAQPDVPRQLVFNIIPGTLAITAGNLAVSYVDQNGLATVDNFSCVTALSVTKTLNTTRGVAKLTSVVASGVVGGNSPAVQGGTNDSLALPVTQGSTGIVINKVTMDGADVATLPVAGAATGVWTPGTIPNGTHTYSVDYSYLAG